MDYEVGMLKRNKDGSWHYPKCKKCGRKIASSIEGYCQTCFAKKEGKVFKHRQYYINKKGNAYYIPTEDDREFKRKFGGAFG